MLVTVCILARNEGRNLEAAIRSTDGLADEVLVLDDGSTDGTAEIARRCGARVVTVDPELRASLGGQFDSLRNLAIEHARGKWVYILDADERLQARLKELLRRLIEEHGDEFSAVSIPFRHRFCGRWMEHSGWWPSYCRPQLLKKGCFRYNEGLHSGVTVTGRTVELPPDLELAVLHETYEDLVHYITKMNSYTSAEAERLLRQGAVYSWQVMVAHLVHDFQQYYDRGRGFLDGTWGLVLALVSGFYRLISWAKLWDLQRKEREREGRAANDPAVPRDTREVLLFALNVLDHGADRWLEEARRPAPAPLLWSGPLEDPSAYADEGRQFVLGLIGEGEPIVLAPTPWGEARAGLPETVEALFRERTVPPDTRAEIRVAHTLLGLLAPSPHARINVARAMFETDRLAQAFVERLNAFDRVWVPSEWGREVFMRSGVAEEKLAVIPGAIDDVFFEE